MKPKIGKISLILRLGAMAGVLLFGQQAMAIGTASGTPIDNTVTVDYFVSGVDQTDLTSSVSFVVDRKVDFTLVALGTDLVDVTPGEVGSFFDFLLTNDSNSALDFSLVLTQLAGGPVRTGTDDAEMQTVDYAVSALSVLSVGGDPDPIRTTGDQFVNSLAPDDSIRVRVWGDAALTMADAEVAGVQLDAIGREPGSGAVTVLAEDPDTPLGVEDVFADLADGFGNIETDFDGWQAQSANLAVTKAYAIVAGDLGSGQPIPGATVEYTITVVNSGGTDATFVVLDDVLTELGGAVSLVLNSAVAPYLGNDLYVLNGAATPACNVESNTDGDGCDLVTTTLTVGSADLAGGLTVAGNTTLTIQYQVTIDNTDTTP